MEREGVGDPMHDSDEYECEPQANFCSGLVLSLKICSGALNWNRHPGWVVVQLCTLL